MVSHMTKMAAMPIFGKNLTGGLISIKLGMKHGDKFTLPVNLLGYWRADCHVY